MKDSDRAKIRKLRGISDVALRLFVVTGIASMAIAILGSFLVSVIVGKEWVRIAVAISAFGGASSIFSYGLAIIMHIRITVVELASKSLTLRRGISAFIGYGLALLVAIGIGYGAIWWGIKYLIDSNAKVIVR
jgi:hypothetical protein